MECAAACFRHTELASERVLFFSELPNWRPDGARVHLASLETEKTAAIEHIAVFEKRFLTGRVSFPSTTVLRRDQRFGRAVNAVKTERAASPRDPAETEPRVAALPSPTKSASPAAGPLVPEVATAARPPFNSGTRAAKARQASVAPPDKKNRTAFYDISAQVVYLPDGRRLEAHSGHGSYMDNARYIHIKNKGRHRPTPIGWPYEKTSSMEFRPFVCSQSVTATCLAEMAYLHIIICWVPMANRMGACHSPITPSS